MSNDRHVHGSWNVICQRCGFQYKAEQLEQEWTGHYVCKGPGTNDCWEPRHPQDFVKVRPDTGKVPYTRPEPRPQFVDVTYTEDGVLE